MIEPLANVLIANRLDPDSLNPAGAGGTIFHGQLPPEKAMLRWVNLAKASAETKYRPIIRGDEDGVPDQPRREPADILAAAPAGDVREILKPRLQDRIKQLLEMRPQFPDRAKAALAEIDENSDIDQLAAAVDASGIHSFVGRSEPPQPWPTLPSEHSKISLQTLKGRKGKPSSLVLIPTERASEAPAYLDFGGWNDCPEPEIQAAVLREWQREYKAAVAGITGDVLECVVVSPPQTEAQAMKLAAEQRIFCDDIVAQGTQSIRKPAIEIWNAQTWFFWWD